MWIYHNILLVTTFLFIIGRFDGCSAKDDRSRKKRHLLEPAGTQMGLFGTIAIPLEYEKSASVAYFFEGNYYTLQNVSYLHPVFQNGAEVDAESRHERSADVDFWFTSLNRKFAYLVLENNFERFGYPGRSCVLRAICEHSMVPFYHNGVLGDIFYIIFTPSSSRDEDLSEQFYEAEKYGRQRGTCDHFQRLCPISLINSISYTSALDNL